MYNTGTAVYNGPYEITLTDITGVKQMVNTFTGGLNLNSSVLIVAGDGDSVDLGDKFTIGAHPAGYLLDRIKVLLFVADGGAVPAISLHPNTSSGPGDKVCDLAVPNRVVESAVDWNTTPPHTFLAPDCADDVLAASTNYWVIFSDMDHVEYELESAANPDVHDYGSGWTLGRFSKRGASNVWAPQDVTNFRGGLWAKEN